MSRLHPFATRLPVQALGVTLSLAFLGSSPIWAAESKSSEKTPPTPPPTTTRTGFFSRSKPAEPAPEKPQEKTPEKTTSKSGEKTSEKSQEKAVEKAPQKPSEPSQSSNTTSAKKPAAQPAQTAAKPTQKAPAANEDELFAQIRQQASEDAKVAELRTKADEAKSKEAAASATKAYLKSLYSKMRSLEPSLKARVDMTEAAALKALESEK
jgi:outer membrane biosynthesis protein TonB